MTTVITPSSHWHGTPHPTSRWSVQQISVLMKEGRDPTVVDAAKVRHGFHRRPGDWMSTPVFFDLPKLAVSRDGKRAKVITPAGFVQWMDIARV